MHLLDRRMLIVTGKGGVGKTMVSVAMALAAAKRGKRVLIAMTNTKERVSQFLQSEQVTEKIVNVASNVDAVNMTPEAALQEYGMMILKVRALYNAIFENRLVRAFLRGTPGLEAWSMLGKAFFHASPAHGEPDYDLVILDAPATGHALNMLRVPTVIQKIVPPGLLRREADRAIKMMRDEKKSGVVLVTLAEDMPVNETIELRDALVNDLELPILHLVVNHVMERLFEEEERTPITNLANTLEQTSPIHSLALAARRRVLREVVQQTSVERVEQAIPIDSTHLPYRFGIEHDRAALDELALAFA